MERPGHKIYLYLLRGLAITMPNQVWSTDITNIFVERLWRTVKYENIYLKDYASVPALTSGLHDYFQFYNHDRPHQSLDHRVPAEVHQFD